VWEEDLCIQCGKCVLVCPHAVIRAKLASEAELADAPDGFKSTTAKWREFSDKKYVLQVAVEDCTGCTLCVDVCPAKDKSNVGRKALNMAPQRPLREEGAKQWSYFLDIPDLPHHTDLIRFNNIKNTQLLQPLFEFSGACSGCGETAYIKLVTQLFGDRTVIANATGCSSIYGGNLPTTPYTKNSAGRGPAWANSLFEDNAEFGLGIRISIDMQVEYARTQVEAQRDKIGADLADAILQADQTEESGIFAQRGRIEELKAILKGDESQEAKDLLALADQLARKTVWIVGGDGWAYDIGYGGLDHVLASGKNVKVLVLDTEVYSNTGGQASKATSRGAVAKFAAGGKSSAKKDLGKMAMAYRNVYVAQIAMGADDAQTLKALREAEAYPGPAIVIAYSHCIAHGIDMNKGLHQQKLAVDSGSWILYRYDPRLALEGKNPLHIDCKAASIPLTDYVYSEMRYQMLRQSNPAAAAHLLEEAKADIADRWKEYCSQAAE
jgi:pyruvate-ferredoxin/flavodoxin oxidoreductase